MSVLLLGSLSYRVSVSVPCLSSFIGAMGQSVLLNRASLLSAPSFLYFHPLSCIGLVLFSSLSSVYPVIGISFRCFVVSLSPVTFLSLGRLKARI